jgi:hypothetical protein
MRKMIIVAAILGLAGLPAGCNSGVVGAGALPQPSLTATPLQSPAAKSPPTRTAEAEPEYFIKVSGNRPYAVAFDNDGSMLMVTAPETGSGELSRVDAKGTVVRIATLDGSFIGPGIDLDNGGNIYVTVGGQLL